MNGNLLQMRNISKSFPGVKALDDVEFSLHHGEVHALVGENGAGKSTLMKILSGIYIEDSGTIMVNGKQHTISTPNMAEDLGIAIIHQELSLIKDLTIAENIFLGCEFKYGKTNFINTRLMVEESNKYLKFLDIDIDPNTVARNLSVGEQQMVEIAKALSKQAKILVLDEPTAALTTPEIESLFKIIASLKEKGVGMVYVSHRMEEIFMISDRITVLRDGRYVATKNTKDTDMQELVKLMVGREITDYYPKWDPPKDKLKEKMRIENLNVEGKLKDISLTVNSGEILGIAGLMGAGRTELAKSLFGIEKPSRGKIWIDGKETQIKNPKDAIEQGISLVTEDRKDEGLVLISSCQDNIALPNMNKISRLGFVSESKLKQLSTSTIDNLSIKTSDVSQTVDNLSGGNQQKVVIGKWLATNPQILILDEPTRGVDVGAKKEIYEIMVELAESGVAIIMISSELPEVLGMSNRILVMHEGRIMAEFDRMEATQEKIMFAATGGKVNG